MSCQAIRTDLEMTGTSGRNNDKSEFALGGKFLEFDGVAFPILPSESYRSLLDSRIKKVISNHGCNERLPTSLCLSWALVLAIYTSSFEVLYGLLDESDGTHKGPDAIVPCHLALQSGDTVQTASDMVNRYWSMKHHFEQLGLSNMRTSSAGATRICDFRNILLIRTLEDLDEEATAALPKAMGSDYPLIVSCGGAGNDVAVHAFFDSAVVCQEMVESMILQFAFTLEQVTSNQDARLADLQESNPEDLAKMVKWNRLGSMEESIECVHRLIERQCEKRPFSPAICAWDGDLSYGQLHRKSSCLARALSTANVGPDKVVFILSEKSKWTPVAILGSLKAGGAFALLDPLQPAHRLATLCDVASPQVVLTSRRHHAKASLLGPPVLIIPDAADDESRPGWRELDPDREVTVESHHALHVGFTSGSTGAPKAVLMSHAAFASGPEVPGLSPESRVLQSTSYSFSACMWEHLVALTRGACLCIPSEDQLEDNMEEVIHSMGVTWAMITPSVARVIEPKKVPSINTLFLVGEAIGRLEIRTWAHQVALYSMYAQSECGSPIMTKHLVEPGDLSTLGCPGWGAGWIVDATDHHRLMPLGAEGELVLQGPCLATCYLNNMEQTRAALITDPSWGQRAGIDGRSRFLKTGDLFSRNPVDGSFQFRGRKGGKVKIRGQRIELAEVEYHLRGQFPDASHVVAEIVRPSDSQSEYGMLVAVVPTVSQSDGMSDSCRLLAPNHTFLHLALRALDRMSKLVPAYMIPSSFISVSKLPRTQSGKLHRKMLVELISQLSRKEILAYMNAPNPYRPAVTTEEAVLQSVCAAVLSIAPEQIGMDDQFVGLGGDSLSARQMVTFARAKGLSITVADCLQQPNLSSLAQCGMAMATAGPSPQGQPAGHKMSQDPFYSLREDFVRNLPEGLTADMIEDVVPVRETQLFLVQYQIMDYLLVQISGLLDPVRLRRACEDLVSEHPILRTIFVPFRDDHVQVALRSVDVPWASFTAPTKGYDFDMWAHSLCAEDRKLSVPKGGPFLKFILLQDGQVPQHTLIIRISHSQFDGLCLGKILNDMAQLYEGQPLNSPTSYADYVRKCAEMRSEESLRLWSDILAGSTPTTIPLTPSGDHPEEKCIVAAHDVLIAIPPPPGITWATTVKAAWSFVLRQETGKDDLNFCQMVNCRYVDVPEPENIVGPCLNPIPVRIQYDASWTAKDLLLAVQKQHIDSLDHQTLEWQDIVWNCTDWPRDTEIDSIVLHENINPSPVTQVGDTIWRLSAHSVDNPPERTTYLYTYPQEDSLYAVVILSSKFGAKSDAERLVNRLCSTVAAFVNSPSTLLTAL